MEREIDILWVLIASALVFIMQAGFLTLEIGLTRSKNNINVALKNLADFALTTLVYWLFGFAFMFGNSFSGIIGTTGFALEPTVGSFGVFTFLIFQVMFCGTAVTIISGAIAERIHFGGFVLIVLFVASLIYPIFGHWAWGGIQNGEPSGWLAAAGFVDFAGSTVVHSIGGWSALAILLIIGARSGRFLADGSMREIPGANIPLAALGVFILWFGWIGFNGGSTLTLNEQVARIILNTMLAGSTGLVVGLFTAYRTGGRPKVSAGMNGILAGLVAITANCHAVTAFAAILIGAIGALVMLASEALLERLRLDDAVGAIPVHLGAGIWGTLAVGIFGQPDLLGTGLDRFGQIVIQLVGIAAAALWTLPLTYLVFRVLNAVRPLRVTPEQEMTGLNVSEHGATTEILDFVSIMALQQQTGDLSLRAPVEPFTEVGQIAGQYNQLIDQLEVETALNRAIVDSAIDGILTFSKGTLEISSVNPAACRMFGYQASDLIGSPLNVLLAMPESEGVPLTPEQLDEVIEYRLAAGGRVELVGMRSNGGRFPMEVMLAEANLRDEPFYTGIFRDVSERVMN